MDCYTCSNPAINACRRCTKPYCDEHGNTQYCAECLQPSSALPSFNLYRGALLAMLVGTALAVLLLVRPPGETRGAQPVLVGNVSPTATASGDDEPTIAAQTPRPATPAGTPTPAVSPTPTESPFGEHVVLEGDTLFEIAEANLPAGDDIEAFARAIAALNGLDYDAPILRVGSTLLLPKPPTPTATFTPQP